MKENNEITEIVSFCIENKIHVEINEYTIKCKKFNGWNCISVESFYSGEGSKIKFMHYTPLSDMLETIKDKMI